MDYVHNATFATLSRLTGVPHFFTGRHLLQDPSTHNFTCPLLISLKQWLQILYWHVCNIFVEFNIEQGSIGLQLEYSKLNYHIFEIIINVNLKAQ